MTNSTNFLFLIEEGDNQAILSLLEQHPKAVHRHMAYPRPWGEELWLPLHHAARLGKTDVIEMLIDKGANLDGRTRFILGPMKARATALHIAVSEHQLEAARLLLRNGADLHARKADNASPREMVEALIDAGQAGWEPFLELFDEFEDLQK